MSTFRQLLIEKNKYRPHEWYTIEEIMKAFRIYERQDKNGKKRSNKSLFIVNHALSSLNGKIVSSRLIPNKDGLVKATFQGKSEYIHLKFLKALK